MPRELPLACFQREAVDSARSGNAALSLSFGREVDQSLWKESWERMVHRHPALRSTFGENSTSLVEMEAVETAWENLDWSGLESPEISQRWSELQRAESGRTFHPQKAPLWRISFITLPGNSNHLLWSMHPAILDEASCGNILLEWFKDATAQNLSDCSQTPSPSAALGAIDLPEDDPKVSSACLSLTDSSMDPFFFLHLPNSQSTKGPAWTESLDLEDSAERHLRELAEEFSANAKEILAAAWAEFLCRSSRTGDALIAVQVDSRKMMPPGFSEVSGYFQARLPLRLRGPDSGSRDWLCSFLENFRSLEQGLFTPWHNSASEEAQLRGLQQIPISEYRFAQGGITDLLHTEMPQWLGSDAAWTPPFFSPLTVTVRKGRNIRLEIHSDSGSLPQQESRFLLQGWRNSLLQLGRDHTEAAPAEIENKEADGAFQLRAEPDFAALLEEHLRTRGSEPAFSLGAEEISATDLLALSNQLCRHLRKLKTQQGSTWLVCMNPSPWQAITLLSLVRDRQSFLMIAPSALPEDPARLLADRQLAGIFHDAQTEESLAAIDLRKVAVDTGWEKIADQPSGPLSPRKTTAIPVWSFWTNGDTEPISYPEPFLVEDILRAEEILKLAPSDRLLSTAAAGSVELFEEFFGCLLAEAVFVLAQESIFSTRSAFQEAIEENRITHIQLPATRWSEWVHFLSELGRTVPPVLRHLNLRAGRIANPVLDEWKKLAGDGPALSVGFSPWGVLGLGWNTESENACSLPPEAGVALGCTAEDCRVHALDDSGNPLPQGIAGKLKFSPPSALTALECDVPDQLHSLSGYEGRDGIWRCLEPIDLNTQDNSFSPRICRLAESALQSHPAVLDCLVEWAGKSNPEKNKSFRAWIILRETGNQLPLDLNVFFRNKMGGDFSLDAAVCLPRFPLDDRGRISTALLPSPAPIPARGLSRPDQPLPRVFTRKQCLVRLNETNPERPLLVVFEKEASHPVSSLLSQSGLYNVAVLPGIPPLEDLAAEINEFAQPCSVHLVGIRDLAWESARTAMELAKTDSLRGLLLLLDPSDREPRRGLAGFGKRLQEAFEGLSGKSSGNIRRLAGDGRVIRCPLPAKVLLPSEASEKLAQLLPAADFFQAEIDSTESCRDAILEALTVQPPPPEDSPEEP